MDTLIEKRYIIQKKYEHQNIYQNNSNEKSELLYRKVSIKCIKACVFPLCVWLRMVIRVL